MKSKSKHYEKVNELYNNHFNYISSLPSFHFGYQMSTDLQLALAGKHVNFNTKNILELCCGTGSSVIYLAEKFNCRITGVDLNEKNVNLTTKKIIENGLDNRCVVLQLNVLDISALSDNYDIIWSEDGFAHIPEKSDLLKECYKKLNINGTMIFSDLIKTENLMDNEEDALMDSWEITRLETYNSYVKLINKCGFHILDNIDKIGHEISKWHVEENEKLGNTQFTKMSYLLSNEKELLEKYGERQYSKMVNRNKVYEYLENKKLDYVFFVMQKCVK